MGHFHGHSFWRENIRGLVNRFSPLDIPGLILWLDAGTIAVPDGTPLSQWNDVSGNGNHCTQGTAGFRPIYNASGVDGHPEVALAYRDLTGSFRRWMTIPNTVQSMGNNMTMVCVSRPINEQLCSGYSVVIANQDNKLGWGLENGAIVANGYHEGTHLVYHCPGFLAVSCGAAASRLWNNGQLDVFAPGLPVLKTGGTLGEDPGGAYVSYGAIYEAMIFNRALSDDEIAKLYAYESAKYWDVPTNQIIHDGDSLTTGYACINNENFPGQLWGFLGPKWRFYSVSVAGQNLLSMIADAGVEIDPKFDASLDHNVIVCWAGLLDVYYGATPATALTRLTTYCQARQAAGWEVVVLTCLPSDYISNPDRATLNLGVRTNWATFADAIADIAADPRIGDDGDNLDPTYYNNSDGVHTHMTPAGFAIVAQIVATAIESL